MTINWIDTGYPLRHGEDLRAAKLYAMRAFLSTGSLFALLMAGTVFGSVPPFLTAISAAIFLMFGVLNGLGSLYDTYRYVKVVLYFERKLGHIDTFLAGHTMARVLSQLDAIAIEQEVRPLSTFGFADDLRGESLQWHDSEEGLLTIAAIIRRIADLDIPETILRPLLDDLTKWHAALERVASEGVSFCILLRHGNSTSGHEWDVRKGSAF